MYFARDNTNGDILNGKNIISIPGQYVGRADYINEHGDNIVHRFFNKEDVILDPGNNKQISKGFE